jgi:hypothetical protein
LSTIQVKEIFVPQKDLYAILGVLPDAEDVVVTAAFRALAQRYHPDRWSGDPTKAHERMTDINLAYEVLSDKARRTEYDATRARSHQADFGTDEDDSCAQAFSAALADTEERWNIACSFYPDLKELRAMLAAISTSLAFAFVTVLLESKSFPKRRELAQHLEKVFLERYFGSNAAVLAYARSLIFSGHKAAARTLNRLVEVMGTELDAGLLITRVDREFELSGHWRRAEQDQLKQSHIRELSRSIRQFGKFRHAQELAEFMGYTVQEVGAGFFKTMAVRVSPNAGVGPAMRFDNRAAFLQWVQENLCSLP